MAMACFGFVTFLPLRPDLSVPRFISFISVSTFLLAEGEYFRLPDFLDADFFPLLLFVVAIFVLLEGQMAHRLNVVVQAGNAAKPMHSHETRDVWAGWF